MRRIRPEQILEGIGRAHLDRAGTRPSTSSRISTGTMIAIILHLFLLIPAAILIVSAVVVEDEDVRIKIRMMAAKPRLMDLNTIPLGGEIPLAEADISRDSPKGAREQSPIVKSLNPPPDRHLSARFKSKVKLPGLADLTGPVKAYRPRIAKSPVVDRSTIVPDALDKARRKVYRFEKVRQDYSRLTSETVGKTSGTGAGGMTSGTGTLSSYGNFTFPWVNLHFQAPEYYNAVFAIGGVILVALPDQPSQYAIISSVEPLTYIIETRYFNKRGDVIEKGSKVRNHFRDFLKPALVRISAREGWKPGTIKGCRPSILLNGPLVTRLKSYIVQYIKTSGSSQKARDVTIADILAVKSGKGFDFKVTGLEYKNKGIN